MKLWESFKISSIIQTVIVDPTVKECGPPTTKYMNTGGGSGASGNVIVSVTGEVLGYDPIDFGTGYSKNTTAYIDDDCGTGSGAIIEPVIEDHLYR